MNKEIFELKTYFIEFIKKTISCEDTMYTIITLIQVYLLMKITSLFNDKFIVYFILNILILYEPLEKKWPNFIFKCRMSFKQIIEGIINLIECLIPKYEDNNNTKENKVQ